MSSSMPAPLPAPESSPALARPPRWVWLVAGVVVTALAMMRYNVGILGWVAAVPWLMWIRGSRGWRPWVVFFGALQLAVFLSVLKIVTEPLPWFFAGMFSVPMAISSFVGFGGFEALRRRLCDAWGVVLFPAIAVLLEYLGATGSDMGSWGAAAYTQLDNLPLMQVTALVGLGGVTALLSASSALIAVMIADGASRWARWGAGLLAVVVLAHAWGSFRMYQPIPGPRVRVATVVTDVMVEPGQLPADAELARAEGALFRRSAEAAAAGARLVVWNEGATAVASEREASFLARAEALAIEHGIDLVVAYVVPIDGAVRFENVYAWVTPQGIVERYLKHHPVPSEGSVRGTAPLVAHDRPYGTAAGAICYDYDFPAMGKAHAALGAGVVAVPSSDWRGIDPYHTQMAAVRGIEGGFSVVRSVRAATSGAFDAYGVARGLARDLDGQHLMWAEVPSQRVPTLYSRIGDLLVALAALLVAAGVARAVPWRWPSRGRPGS